MFKLSEQIWSQHAATFAIAVHVFSAACFKFCEEVRFIDINRPEETKSLTSLQILRCVQEQSLTR